MLMTLQSIPTSCSILISIFHAFSMMNAVGARQASFQGLCVYMYYADSKHFTTCRVF
jgi:hypothetical protein